MNPLPVLLLALSASVAFAAPPVNLDFESDAPAGRIPGWFVPPVCAQEGWSAKVSDADPAQGRHCVELKRSAPQPAKGGGGGGFGNFMQSFDAADYRGKRLTITLKVRLSENATGAGCRIQPWVRVDREGEKMGFFDNCADRPVTAASGGAWQTLTITGDIDPDAAAINLGMMVLGGDGPAYLDDIAITARDRPAARNDPPRELTARALANLEALTRAIGYIRHYYPGDQAAALFDQAGTDVSPVQPDGWSRFTVDAVLAAEPAASADELAATLTRLFAPIAPAARFQTKEFPADFDPKFLLAETDKPTATICWRHRGFAPGAKQEGAIYFSERITTPTGEAPEENLPEIGASVTRRVLIDPAQNAQFLSMRIPIVLYKSGDHTLPRPTTLYSPPADAPDLTATDRATRLAAVILAWNVLQHHFPYFDVIKDEAGRPVDWDAALREALTSAATDPDAAAFQGTLERLITHLHDGHGHVSGGGTALQSRVGAFCLPLLLTFIPTQPESVVLNAAGNAVPQGVLPGDTIISIGGHPIADLIADARAHEPAATEGNFHTRAARRLIQRDSADPVEVIVRQPVTLHLLTVTLKPITPDKLPPERSGPTVSEPKPGIWYIDLDRASEQDIQAAMKSLAQAKGIVFDMRGYPNNFNMSLLGHLSTRPLKCAKWEIPLANFPDRQHPAFDHARWDIPPAKPRLCATTLALRQGGADSPEPTDKQPNSAPAILNPTVAFITDGRAISAAETFLGIVEAYHLAHIVGEPTAGTNGNVNLIHLPGGFTISYTGMKVLKHDGSQHHAIGIRPTIEAHRTIQGIAAGKDELLDRALEAVSAPAPPRPDP